MPIVLAPETRLVTNADIEILQELWQKHFARKTATFHWHGLRFNAANCWDFLTVLAVLLGADSAF
jgi:hypothetical protein